MRRRIRIFLLLGVFVSVGGVAYKVVHNLWLQKVREIEESPLKLLDFVPDAALRLKNFRRSKVENGRTVWEVVGEEAAYLKAEKEAVIRKPRLILYGKNGEAMEVLGNEGHLFLTDRQIDRMALRGAVVVHYKGLVLRTDEILFHQGEDHIMTDGKVTVNGEGLELEGVGMEISLGEGKILLRDRVRTKIRPDRLKSNQPWNGG